MLCNSLNTALPNQLYNDISGLRYQLHAALNLFSTTQKLLFAALSVAYRKKKGRVLAPAAKSAPARAKK